ncbi:hypothetical protein LEP1GSC127_1390 [Leptospira kirschneri str. 200801925]|nr:hypothetical protein LEP1GSC127_1390 [Leptospira kirschneri str. 200801925]
MNWQNIKESASTIKNTIWEAILKAVEKINQGYLWLFRTASEDGVSRKTLFLTYSWIGVVLFLLRLYFRVIVLLLLWFHFHFTS